ncbi:MAG: hypothetical protein V4819_17040 [Verrucomicrobiota bacterium]
MKIWISIVLTLITSTAAFAAGESPPRFHHVADFLTWADKKLSAHDYEALITAQADAKDPTQTQLAYVKQLDADLGEAKLAKVFEGREFPKDAVSFKLGGHHKELAHCHIDFVKEGDSWKIARIWQCR